MDRDTDLPASAPASADDGRVVDIGEDDQRVLPDQTRDDTDGGWGEDSASNDRRLLDERPPHWE